MNTLRKIEHADLLRYCGQDATRPHLMRPWTGERDGVRRLYATDGKILIEAHEDDLADPVDWDLFPVDAGPRYDAVGYLQQRLDAVTLDRRAMRLDHPDLPEIVTTSAICPECGGEGSVGCACPSCREAAHDCPHCAGGGRVVTHEPAAIPLYGHWISSLNLERLRPLPRLLFLDCTDGHLGVPFVWGERGKGFVLPMRVTAQATPETIRVRAVERRVG